MFLLDVIFKHIFGEKLTISQIGIDDENELEFSLQRLFHTRHIDPQRENLSR